MFKWSDMISDTQVVIKTNLCSDILDLSFQSFNIFFWYFRVKLKDIIK